ncbi:MAG TPA: hypothetical protein ENI15_03715 [Spirochaetes bacterium]|nr:hypothetical protein [Spirochaetota bacterium]
MNYLSSDGCYADFYHDALLCGCHGNIEINENIDEFGAFPEMAGEFFSFSSVDASDFDKAGELNAA